MWHTTINHLLLVCCPSLRGHWTHTGEHRLDIFPFSFVLWACRSSSFKLFIIRNHIFYSARKWISKFIGFFCPVFWFMYFLLFGLLIILAWYTRRTCRWCLNFMLNSCSLYAHFHNTYHQGIKSCLLWKMKRNEKIFLKETKLP